MAGDSRHGTMLPCLWRPFSFLTHAKIPDCSQAGPRVYTHGYAVGTASAVECMKLPAQYCPDGLRDMRERGKVEGRRTRAALLCAIGLLLLTAGVMLAACEVSPRHGLICAAAGASVFLVGFVSLRRVAKDIAQHGMR